MHKHHKTPRHVGGSDDPENLVSMTIEEHAEEHRILYEKHRRWQDKLAWKGLAGLIGKEELMKELLSEAGKKGGRATKGKKRNWKRGSPPWPKGSKPERFNTSGRKWFHDPITGERKALEERDEIPLGWKRGQGKKTRNRCFWFTNEIEEGQFEIGAQPEGWRRGRLRTTGFGRHLR